MSILEHSSLASSCKSGCSEILQRFLDAHTDGEEDVKIFLPGYRVNPHAFENLQIFPKGFWKERHGTRSFFALGELVAGSLECVMPFLKGTGLRAFGGRAFSAAQSTKISAWKGWPDDYFFIPAIEFHVQAGGTVLKKNCLPAVAKEPLELREFFKTKNFGDILCADEIGEQNSYPTAIARCDRPDYRGWSARVHSVLGEIERDALQKVVLARVSTLDLLDRAGAYCLLSRLELANPHCTIFAISPSAQAGTFLGASPERLFRREANKLFTEAVAGTRLRSLDLTEDLRMERQLLDSIKERHEQGIVAKCLADAMRRLCGSVWTEGQTEVLKLSRLQHLRSSFAGQLQDGCTDLELLDTLHPTPATCGFPVAAARDFLAVQEPFNRGWYAGPVGVVSEDESEFCVAIRSFHMRDGEVDVYAGAGIVEGCDAAREWAELESKIAGGLPLFSAT